MSFFRHNPNEVSYVGGRKHWTDVIKNSGPGEMLIWRQPEEDFNVNSTLIVMPGEQAFFVNGGIVEQGSPKELLARRGAYYELYMAQFADVV